MGDLADWKLFFLFSLASSFFPSSSLLSLFPPHHPLQFYGGNVHWWNKTYMFCAPSLPSQFSQDLSKEEIHSLLRGCNHLHNYMVEDSWLNVFRPCSFLASAYRTVPFARVISEFSRNLPGVFVFVKEVRPSQELPSQMGVECQPKHWDQSSWFLSKDSGW